MDHEGSQYPLMHLGIQEAIPWPVDIGAQIHKPIIQSESPATYVMRFEVLHGAKIQ